MILNLFVGGTNILCMVLMWNLIRNSEERYWKVLGLTFFILNFISAIINLYLGLRGIVK